MVFFRFALWTLALSVCLSLVSLQAQNTSSNLFKLLERHLVWSKHDEKLRLALRQNEEYLLSQFLLIEAFDQQGLLEKVDKVNLLALNYVPTDLVFLDEHSPPLRTKRAHMQIRSLLLSDLKALFRASQAHGLQLEITSAFRNSSYQRDVYLYNVRTLGEKKANEVSAKPGSSEHQLGTTIDFLTPSTHFETFQNSPESHWLIAHAHLFGFILSYPQEWQEETSYTYEAWHYRYVGRNTAAFIHQYWGSQKAFAFFRFWHTNKNTIKWLLSTQR